MLLASLALITTHAVLYLAWLRRRVWFGQERGILLFHVLSFVALAVGLTAFVILEQGAWLTASGALCLHGIYSLSFLELWALSEGGFSLAILRAIANRRMSPADITKAFTTVADRKREGRLQGLIGLRMAAQDEETFRATALGRSGALVLRLITTLNNMDTTG